LGNNGRFTEDDLITNVIDEFVSLSLLAAVSIFPVWADSSEGASMAVRSSFFMECPISAFLNAGPCDEGVSDALMNRTRPVIRV
jgi:hypothetical protein